MPRIIQLQPDRFVREHWQALVEGRIDAARIESQVEQKSTTQSAAVLPGSFNPLHDGHRRMAVMAQELLKTEVAFELSLVNVDKPALEFADVTSRLRQFQRDQPVIVTRAPGFCRKVVLFPETTFVVGVDTMERVADSRYYGRDTSLAEAIELFAAQRTRFLVFGRSIRGKVQQLADLNLPARLVALCQQVPVGRFRVDVSSTELRKKEV